MSMDPRFVRLLAAARVWRASHIPGTSTASLGPTERLLRAVDAFDAEEGDDEPQGDPA